MVVASKLVIWELAAWVRLEKAFMKISLFFMDFTCPHMNYIFIAVR